MQPKVSLIPRQCGCGNSKQSYRHGLAEKLSFASSITANISCVDLKGVLTFLSKGEREGLSAVLEDEAQCLLGDTSENSVSEQTGEGILTCVFNELQAFHRQLDEVKDKENQNN